MRAKRGCAVMGRMWPICLADLRERTRRFSFWAMAALCLFAAFMFVPNPATSFRVLVLDAHIYAQASNPSWIPMASALCTGLLLPLLGFAFVKNAIGADRDSGTMNLLQSTRLPRLRYIGGKFGANLGILLAMLGVLILGALVMATIKFPGRWLSPWVLFSPFLALIPGLVFTSALAVFCEVMPFLRSKTGGAFAMLGIFILQTTSIVSVVDDTMGVSQGPMALFDIAGYQWLFGGMHAASIAATGRPIQSSRILGGGQIQNTGTAELLFGGVTFNAQALAGAATLLLCSAVMLLLATLLLEHRPLATHRKRRSTLATPRQGEEAQQVYPLHMLWAPAPMGRFSLPGMVYAELRRLAKTIKLLWWLPALCLLLAMVFAPQDMVLNWMLFTLYGWALLPFSAMGSEEKTSGMAELFCTVDGGAKRQTAAAYMAGAVFSLLLAFPAAVRMMLAGHVATGAAVLTWALAIPAVASALGGLSRGPRPFQIGFIVVLYIALNMPQVFFPLGGAAFINALVYLACGLVSLLLLLYTPVKATVLNFSNPE